MRKVLCPRSCPVIGAARCGPPAQFLASALASPLAQSVAHTTCRVSRHAVFPKLRFPVAAPPSAIFPLLLHSPVAAVPHCRVPLSSLLPFLPLPPRRAAFRRPGGQAHGRDQTVSNSPRSTIRSPLSRDTPRSTTLRLRSSIVFAFKTPATQTFDRSPSKAHNRNTQATVQGIYLQRSCKFVNIIDY